MFRKIGTMLFVVSSISVTAFAQKLDVKQYPKVDFTKVGDSEFDTLWFSGIVKSTYKCPLCPPGAQCKPCIGDHVEVTNGTPEFNFSVFTHQLSLFEVDKTYEFLTRFRSALHRRDNIELIEAKAKK